jgi:hypothetical protein
LFPGSGFRPRPGTYPAQYLINRVPAHPEDFGRFGLVSLDMIQDPQQVTLLDGLHADQFFVVAFNRRRG